MITALLACLLALPAVAEPAAARRPLAEGRPAAALARLEALLAQGPDAREPRLLLAQAQHASGDPRAAVETLDPLTGSGEDAEALLASGRAFKAWGEQLAASRRGGDDAGFAFDEARSMLERAAKAGAAGAAVELGYLELYVMGDHDAALARARSLLEANKDDGEALLLKGCAGLYASIAAANESEEAGAGARADAIAALLAADKALPKTRYEPWVQLAWIYEADGQAEKAVEAAAKILDRFPAGDFTTLFHLATRYAAERSYPAAARALVEMQQRDAKQLERLVAFAENSEAVAVSLAWAVEPLVTGQRAELARDVLASILASRPKNADVWNNYGLLCRDTRQYENSYMAYSKAVELDPGNPRFLNDAAVLLHYYLHRDYDKATDLYEQAIESADTLLADEGLDAATRADLAEARKDAANNLAKLARGEYEWS